PSLIDVDGVVSIRAPSRYTRYPATATLSVDADHWRRALLEETVGAVRPVGTDGDVVSGAAFASSTSTQSEVPSSWLPGGVKSREPVFGNGEPAIGAKVPLVGSYQEAVAAAARRDMATVIVREVGRYAITSPPSGVRAAVQ